jgi:hypothetical protein
MRGDERLDLGFERRHSIRRAPSRTISSKPAASSSRAAAF